ncbi:hypothetical protein ABZ471_23610 [Streptomyces sp. NPDC005728]|uniref:hypothetical protein n=1 Tax=Streptomyces sp. NPDC005728 TaxID=3157054 RepID=UPI0033C6FE45
MTSDRGLPYEECKRQQERAPQRDRAPEPLDPAYVLPPFHPGTHRHRRARRVGGDTVSAVLTALSVTGLLVAIVVAATLPAWRRS